MYIIGALPNNERSFKMNRYIVIFMLAAFLTISGCTDNNLSANENRIEPKYNAEIIVEEKNGEFSMSGSTQLTYITSSTETSSQNGSGTFTKKEEQTSYTQMFTSSMVGDGRMCDISPRFLRHDSGRDVWSFDMKYSKNGKVVLAKSEITVSFDGKNPVMVMEDVYHSVFIRPVQ
jgi:hypothetical protein